MISHIAPQHVVRPRSVEDLVEILHTAPDLALVGGGTLEVPDWEQRGAPPTVVHLPSIHELRRRDANQCGAAVTLAGVVGDERLPRALRQAAVQVGGPALRNMATLGGNVAAGRPGCLAVVLLALGAQCCVLHRGDRDPLQLVRLDQVCSGQNQWVVVSMEWAQAAAAKTHFAKVAVRAAGGPVVASVAVHVDGPSSRIAVGGTGCRPHRLARAEGALRQDAPLAAMTELARDEVTVADDATGSASHRRAVVGTLVKRLIRASEQGVRAA